MTPRAGWLVLALSLPACSIRADFARPTREPLRVVDDPRRPGRAVAMQGDATLDEESFYRITGDAEAAQRFETHRRGGVPLRVAGIVTAGVGGATLPFGLFFLPWPRDSVLENSAAGAALVGAGTALVVTGLVLEIVGEARMRDPELRLLDDPARMRREAERYDERLQAGADPGR